MEKRILKKLNKNIREKFVLSAFESFSSIVFPANWPQEDNRADVRKKSYRTSYVNFLKLEVTLKTYFEKYVLRIKNMSFNQCCL